MRRIPYLTVAVCAMAIAQSEAIGDPSVQVASDPPPTLDHAFDDDLAGVLASESTLALQGMTVFSADGDIIVTRLSADEIVIEADPAMEVASISMSPRDASAYLDEDGELVLENVRHVVFTESGELVNARFHESTEAEGGAACGMTMVIKDGKVTTSCNGRCPEGKTCTMRIAPYVPPARTVEEDDVPAAEPAAPLPQLFPPRPWIITCGCRDSTSAEEPGESAPDVQYLFERIEISLPSESILERAAESGCRRVSGLREVLITEDGELLELNFGRAGQDGEAEECGIVVEVDDDGTVTFKCEGRCPPENPHCRMTLIEYRDTLRYGDEDQESSHSPVFGEGSGSRPEVADIPGAAKKKFRVRCDCKDT